MVARRVARKARMAEQRKGEPRARLVPRRKEEEVEERKQRQRTAVEAARKLHRKAGGEPEPCCCGSSRLVVSSPSICRRNQTIQSTFFSMHSIELCTLISRSITMAQFSRRTARSLRGEFAVHVCTWRASNCSPRPAR